MTDSKFKYHAKNIGYYSAKTINNKVTGLALIFATATVLPYMALTNQTFDSDADTKGTEQSQEVLKELVSEKDSLLSKIQKYNEIKDQQNAYDKIGNRVEVIALADDVLTQKYKIDDAVKEFLANAYSNGSSEEGLAISETNFRTLLNDVKNTNYSWKGDTASLLNGATYAEHMDEARMQVLVSPDADVKTVFANTAKTMKEKAYDLDDNEIIISVFSILLGTWLPALLMGGLLSGFKEKTEYMRKPEKPKNPNSH